MTDISEMSQEEYLEYERKREVRRAKVVKKLDEKIQRDTIVLIEKTEALVEMRKTSASRTRHIKDLELEVRELSKWVEANREIRRVIANPDPGIFRHGDLFDRFLDRDFDSHGGVMEGARTEALPIGGIGFTFLLELREQYYKWKEGMDGSKSDE